MQGLVSAVASFVPNLIILTAYFSSIVSVRQSLHTYGFIMALLGTSAGFAFALAVPLLPAAISWVDLFHGVLFVIWLALVRHYTQMSWPESIAAALIGTFFYAVVSLLAAGLVAGYLEIIAA